MPSITVNNARLHYTDTGQGAETILFSHGLLWSSRMYEAQIAELSQRYRCIAFDHRGQGDSEVTRAGYDMDSLADDAAALIEALNIGPCHFVGLSMGGFIGMRLGARRPELLRSLTLMETSADAETPESAPRYRQLGLVARYLGIRPVASRIMSIMFGQSFLKDPARVDLRKIWKRELLRNRRSIYRAVEGVINRDSVYSEIAGITVPTLIIVGDEDVATKPDKAERMHACIPESRLVVIPGAGHTSTVEAPDAVNTVLNEFLGSLPR